MICSSQTVRLVSHCFTTRTSRKSGTSRGHTLSLSNDMQFTNCTTRNPLFHDPYESYESNDSWTCIYTSSLYNYIQFTNCTTRKPLFHDQYDSHESNGSCEKEFAIHLYHSAAILVSVGNKGFVFALSLPVQPHTE